MRLVMFNCVFVTFPCGTLGQVWYIFVSIPDLCRHFYFNVISLSANKQSKKGCKDQESIQSSTTPDPGYQRKSDKLTVRLHKREPRGQPFPSR